MSNHALNIGELITFLIGLFGLFYVIYSGVIFLFNPLKRDRILMGKYFFLFTCLFVFLIPFAIASIFSSIEFLFGATYVNFKDLLVGGTALEDLSYDEYSILQTVYFHFVTPENQFLSHGQGQIYAAIIALLGLFLFNGLLVSALISIIDNRKAKLLAGEVRYSHFLNNHSIVIGANDMSVSIISHLLKKSKYVILQTTQTPEKVRAKLTDFLGDDCERVIIYNAVRDSSEEIDLLRAYKSSEVFILGESSEAEETESSHDSLNMKAVRLIADSLRKYRYSGKLRCHVLFEHQTTFSIFQHSDLPSDVKENLEFLPFNVYEDWARKVLVDNRVVEDGNEIEYKPLDNCGITSDSQKHVHLVIVGFSRMGTALAIQAAQMAHFPNFHNRIRTHITFIDTNADSEMNVFKSRFANMFDVAKSRYADLSQPYSGELYSVDDSSWHNPLADSDSQYSYLVDKDASGNLIGDGNFIDIQWEFLKGDVESTQVREYLKRSALDASAELTVAICIPKAHQAISASLYLPTEVYRHALQILVYQKESSEIIYNLFKDNESSDKRYAKLRPFGMLSKTYSDDSDYLAQAMLCNYVYSIGGSCIKDSQLDYNVLQSALSIATNDSLGDIKSQWDALSIEAKWSNFYLAYSLSTRLRSVGVSCQTSVNDISHAISCTHTLLASLEHNRWNIQQLLMGLRPFTLSEYTEYFSSDDKGAYKKLKKCGFDKAHFNICSNQSLQTRVETNILSVDTLMYDYIINASIPNIINFNPDHRCKQTVPK